MAALAQGAFTERERWVFDNDGVIVVPDAISPCAHHSCFSTPCTYIGKACRTPSLAVTVTVGLTGTPSVARYFSLPGSFAPG